MAQHAWHQAHEPHPAPAALLPDPCLLAAATPAHPVQVAVAQGDSLVHFEDGPNRTMQVRLNLLSCYILTTDVLFVFLRHL